MKALETVTVETGPNPQFSIIWMHGLGADGHDFEPLVPELLTSATPALRFIFPHAPVRPVTINNGYQMRAWYDILSFDRSAREDAAGLKESAAAITALIEAEKERGVLAARILLAGFSQGGVMALYTGLRHGERLGGIVALSCYLARARNLEAERAAANNDVPIFMVHGTQDPVLAFSFGDESRKQLQATGYPLEWHAYAMPHSLCAEEVADLKAWLARRFAAA